MKNLNRKYIMEVAITLLLMSGFLFYAAKKQLKKTAEMKEMGFDLDNKVEAGKYVGGHPNIDKPSEKMVIVKKDGILNLLPFVNSGYDFPKIDPKLIKNIVVEDKSVMGKRVTVTRLLLTGLIAFAWKKNTKDECAYLVIEWNDGRFEHETIFEYTKKGAFEKANTARNQLMRMIK